MQTFPQESVRFLEIQACIYSGRESQSWVGAHWAEGGEGRSVYFSS